MSNPRQSRARDLAIRLAGLALLLVGTASIDRLCHLANAAPAHAVSATELLLAAAGFVCLSLGSALLALGCHIFDEVQISARWARPQNEARP